MVYSSKKEFASEEADSFFKELTVTLIEKGGKYENVKRYFPLTLLHLEFLSALGLNCTHSP